MTRQNIDGDYLRFKRTKTARFNHLKLNAKAKSVLPEPTEDNTEFLFVLPSRVTCITYLNKWAKTAQIDKHLTWHTARHSLGALLINAHNVNVRTVQDILGHSDLKMTMRYTSIKNETKDNALDALVE